MSEKNFNFLVENHLPGTENEIYDIQRESCWLIIIIYYDAHYNLCGRNIECEVFMKEFLKNSKNYKIYNKSLAQTMEEIKEIFNRHEDIPNLWLVLIGSAIEYGPVAADNKCLNLKKILELRQQEINNQTFLSIFACPHPITSQIQHDARDSDGAPIFSDLQPHSTHYKDQFNEIETLQIKLQSELNQLNPSTNYFLTSVPIPIVDDINKKSIFKYFIDHLNIDEIENIQWPQILSKIFTDLRRSPLDNALMPLCRINGNCMFGEPLPYWHATIIVNYEEAEKSSMDIICENLSEFLKKLNIKTYYFVNKKSCEIWQDIKNNCDCNANISKLWIVFVGSSANKFYEMAKGTELNKILIKRGQENKLTFFSIFTGADSCVPSHSEQFNKRPTFSDLQSSSCYVSLRDYIIKEQKRIKLEILDQLNSFVNYFFTSIPFSVVDENKKSILNYFMDSFNVNDVGSIQLAPTLNGILFDLRRSSLIQHSILPIFQSHENILI